MNTKTHIYDSTWTLYIYILQKNNTHTQKNICLLTIYNYFTLKKNASKLHDIGLAAPQVKAGNWRQSGTRGFPAHIMATNAGFNSYKQLWIAVSIANNGFKQSYQ